MYRNQLGFPNYEQCNNLYCQGYENPNSYFSTYQEQPYQKENYDTTDQETYVEDQAQ
jgi:hypothetical protein